MYFILSKILLFVILPLNWIIVLFVISFFIKNVRSKRRYRLAALLLLLIFTNPFLINGFAKLWDVTDTTLPVKSYSCAIILGGYGSQKSRSQGYFNGSSDRFIEGVELYQTGKAQNLLISGANGSLDPDGFVESAWVAGELRKIGVPQEHIILEQRSRNTKENAVYSKQLLLAAHIQPQYILITSAFHMRRSLYLFKKAGMDVTPYSCNYIAGVGKNSIFNLMPDAEALYKWNTYLKEVTGYLVAHVQQ